MKFFSAFPKFLSSKQCYPPTESTSNTLDSVLKTLTDTSSNDETEDANSGYKSETVNTAVSGSSAYLNFIKSHDIRDFASLFHL